MQPSQNHYSLVNPTPKKFNLILTPLGSVWFGPSCCSAQCLVVNSDMASYMRTAKKAKSVNRLLKFIKKKCLEENRPNPLFVALPSTSFTPNLPPKPKQILAYSRITSTDVPPDIKIPKKPCLSFMCVESTDLPPADQNPAPYLPSSLKDVSLRNQPRPQSSILPNKQTYCTTCQKIFATKDDEIYHQDTQYGREDCYLLRSMLP